MDETHFRRIKHLIATRIGLMVRAQEDVPLRRAIAERMSALSLTHAEQYRELLDSPEGIAREREALAVSLTTGETYFFRDRGQHLLLQNRILPDLMERRKAQRSLRIWSAACSSGEEAYSLAILLDELMGGQWQWDVLILGTDIDRHAIEKARQGIYSEWSFRGMSEERRQRYFRRHKNMWLLDEGIRSKVRFRTGDLVDDIFPDQASELHDMDLILCRNTFIYMTPGVVSHIADKFAATLAEGGVLITGHGELYSHHLGLLRTRVYPESIAYQKAAMPPELPLAPPVEPMRTRRAVAVRSRAAAPPIGQTTPPAPPAQAEPERGSQQEAVSRMQQAWAYANQGRREMAEQVCREMIAGDPLEAEPYYLLALLAQERGDLPDAKELLKKAIYLEPSFIAVYLDLGDIYAAEGDEARARRMRSTARDILKALPGSLQLRLYGASTADEVLSYVEHLLNISKP